MVDKIRVLVVDDSSFFRTRIRQELERTGAIEVAGEAVNGAEAVRQAASLRPDLITMDVAMPVMDGISAVREIMRASPTAVVMFSALTRDGAKATLEALEAGAVDFLPKQPGALVGEGNGMGLSERVINIARHKGVRRAQQAVARPAQPVVAAAAAPAPAHAPVAPSRRRGQPRLVVIGASTGGPVAIQKVLTALPAGYPYPVLVAVHMPAEFTPTFAERLDSLCRLEVRQAVDGDELRAGRALIAPGGMQTLVESAGGRLRVKLMADPQRLYKPSVDITFGSAARALGEAVQAVILTGMGADGTEGARLLKERGASVWSQDQATSVVYGMPQSVAKAGYTDRVLALEEIGPALGGLA
jgi:two-component system chemotaxis response regulator CheB